jgi:hypothetical protein
MNNRTVVLCTRGMTLGFRQNQGPQHIVSDELISVGAGDL